MGWQSEVQLRDIRDVYLDEVAKHMSCRRHGCTHTGVNLSLIRKDETSGFVGGMP